MGQWSYTLKNSEALRDAIHSGDLENVLNQLEVCWKEINQELPEYFDNSDLDYQLDDIENERDNLLNYEDYDMTEEDVEENVDWLLDKLYDVCDDLRIWIEI